MKRVKTIFAFVLVPFFLFSFQWRLFNPLASRGDQPDQTAEISAGDPGSSWKGNQPLSDGTSRAAASSLREKSGESKRLSSQDKEFRRIQPENSNLFRREKDKEQNRSLLRQKIGVLNDGQPIRSRRGPSYPPDQVLVKFKPWFSEEMREAAIAAYRCQKIKRIPRLNVYKLQIPDDVSLEEMLYLLRMNPDVEYAEPNHRRYLTVTPNDPLFSEQYALYNYGQEVGPPGSPQGTARADIKAREGWEETQGDEVVVIAILDTGIDFDHPDLQNKIYSTGYDFANDDPDPTDDYWHGTHVSGIAAADTNNRQGIAGVGWMCTILPIKVFFVPADPMEEPYAESFWIAEGIRYAVDNGAQVINLSLGGEVPSATERNAIQYAFDSDVVVVAASGNDSGAVLYPAAYEEYVLAVAATDFDDLRPGWSNYGPEIDVAAPGVWIISCFPLNLTGPGRLPYAWATGTSMSSPHAAGLAALIKTIKPALTARDIMNVIRYTADDVNSVNYPGRDDFIGYGRINMEKALVPIKITSSEKR